MLLVHTHRWEDPQSHEVHVTHHDALRAVEARARQPDRVNRLFLWGHCTEPTLLASILLERMDRAGPTPWQSLRGGPGRSLVVTTPRRMAGVFLDVFDRHQLGPIAGIAVEHRVGGAARTFVGCTLWRKRWTILDDSDKTHVDGLQGEPMDLWLAFGTAPFEVWATAHDRLMDHALLTAPDV